MAKSQYCFYCSQFDGCDLSSPRRGYCSSFIAHKCSFCDSCLYTFVPEVCIDCEPCDGTCRYKKRVCGDCSFFGDCQLMHKVFSDSSACENFSPFLLFAEVEEDG